MKLIDTMRNLEKTSVKWNTYYMDYEKHLEKYVGNSPTVLEIGVADGGSLELWSKYFINGEIHGLDIDSKIMDYKYRQPNIFCHLGDQSDPEYWKHFNKNTDVSFDIIIDDGSHINSDQIMTLVNLFPRLKDGGTYIVEDTHTSYWQTYGGGLKKPNTFIETVKTLVDFLHRDHIDSQPNKELVSIFGDLKSMVFYNSMVILEKQKYVAMVPYGVRVNKG